ncbi:MAG TPA: elongation factor P, partial [Terriglobales bacterium]
MALSANQMRPGMVIMHDNELFSVFSITHRTPGNLRAFVQAKIRNLRTGGMIEYRFRSDDRIERAMLDENEMEFLYSDGDAFYFMNTENYEQMHLMKDILGDAVNYLVPQLRVKVEFFEGKPISVELPPTVDM